MRLVFISRPCSFQGQFDRICRCLRYLVWITATVMTIFPPNNNCAMHGSSQSRWMWQRSMDFTLAVRDSGPISSFLATKSPDFRWKYTSDPYFSQRGYGCVRNRYGLVFRRISIKVKEFEMINNNVRMNFLSFRFISAYSRIEHRGSKDDVFAHNDAV